MAARKITIQDIRAHAGILGGSCLRIEYFDDKTLLKWRCEKGHTRDVDYRIIKQGGWCMACLKRENDFDKGPEKLLSIFFLNHRYQNNFITLDKRSCQRNASGILACALQSECGFDLLITT